MKMSNLQGDVSDVSAKKGALSTVRDVLKLLSVEQIARVQ